MKKILKNVVMIFTMAFLCVGCLNQSEKNIEEFIKIAEKISSTRNDIKFVIIGDGSLKSNLISQISSEISELKSNIIFLGFRDDIPQILSSLDIFLSVIA